MADNESRSDTLRSTVLCVLALVNYLIFYLVNILLARNLTQESLGDYYAGISTAMVLSTLATLGLEKYALRCIPVYYERSDWSHARGFWRFSVQFILVLSVILFVINIILFELRRANQQTDHHIAILIVCAFLPIIALFLFMVEVVSANGAQLRAIAIYRFLLPAALLVLNTIVWLTPLKMSAVQASLCYGTAWTIGLIVIHLFVSRTTPAEVRQAQLAYARADWFRNSLPLLGNSLLLTLLAHSGVIILEFVHPSEGLVGAYAVAAHTGTFVVLLATSTNRFYLPRLSLCIERKDKQRMIRLARNRLWFVAPLTVSYLLCIFLFGKQILGVFGPGFSSAYGALCMIASGASASTLFAVAPYYLQFLQHNKTVLACTLLTVATSIGACFPLSYHFGDLGAAVAYAVPLAVLFVVLRVIAIHHLRSQWESS